MSHAPSHTGQFYHVEATSQIHMYYTNASQSLGFNVTAIPSSYNASLNTTETQDAGVETLKELVDYLWKCVPPVFILMGVLGNILNIIVVWKMKFWSKTPLFLLAVLAFTDITVLLVGLLRYWILYTFKLDVRVLSDGGCQVNMFVLYLSMQFSSWILVCMTMDRFLKTNFPFRYIRVVSINKTIITVCIVFVIIAGVNLHFFWANGVVKAECDDITKEYEDFENFYFVFIDLAIMSFIPFVIMSILNCFIYRALKQHNEFRCASVVESQRHRFKENRRVFSKKLTRMLLVVSLYFLVATLPISIYYVVDSFVQYDKGTISGARKKVIWTVLYLFQNSNYSLNFVWYAAHNKVFREKMKEVIGFKPKGFRYRNTTRERNEISSTVSHMTTSLDNSTNDNMTPEACGEYSEDEPSLDRSNSIITNENEHIVQLNTNIHL